MNVELVNVTTRDGLRLDGLWRKPEAGISSRLGVDVVVLHHGVGGNFYGAGMFEGFSEGGMHWGPVAQTQPKGGEPGPTEAQLTAARSHGRWVAECVARWRRGQSTEGSE